MWESRKWKGPKTKRGLFALKHFDLDLRYEWDGIAMCVDDDLMERIKANY